MLPAWEGRVCRGLSRGSLPVRNTGEMGAGTGSSARLTCGVPGRERAAIRNDVFAQPEASERVGG